MSCTVCYRNVGLLLLLISFLTDGFAQRQAGTTNGLVYIDKEGVMRWKKNKAEAAFFGVNYTTPFAYAYRAHKALNVDIEKAIQQDVYHMARLGLDAFRVHVWDNEISDVNGALLENEHLRLFDFLLAELKKRNIKTIVTPIAFWGTGYPERDGNMPGFSSFYGRGKLTTNDSAIMAQENYLRQFFQHVNPYTNLTYGNDPDVIAVEINNEPSHSGPKSGVTAYIDRLAAAIKSTGWSKPVFYNISQGPYYADAVARSVADGFSFQWYPSGLVAGHTLKGNYLPHVDQYTIPFDTIPAFRKKALMVYEFDAADIMDSYMYPAMARSFRKAGFQWATQFAYDPMSIAHANTEYQTHYVNLAYTPSKAISLLIASKVFHNVLRLKDYGAYPADSVFDAFRLSYKESLSEMNTKFEFYYSNSTRTAPVDTRQLRHIAGVGSSAVVQYEGSGAYFLDKLEEGVWRLEVMPDAIHIRDPFEKASPKKEVTRIQWQANHMRISLPDLDGSFSINGLNEGNVYTAESDINGFTISPGTYLLTRKGRKFSGKSESATVRLNEFVAPRTLSSEMYLYHEPFDEVSSGRSFTIRARVVAADDVNVSVEISRMGGPVRNIAMVRKNTSEFFAEVPSELVVPGMLSYRIVMRRDNDVSVFPGNIKDDPRAWDTYKYETWKTFVADVNGGLEIYNPTNDLSVSTYPVFRRDFQTSYITGEKPGQLIFRMTANELAGFKVMGMQHAFVEKLKGRKTEIDAFDKLIVRARSANDEPVRARVALICADASAMSVFIDLTGDFRDIEIPLTAFIPDSAMLMPRPYPGFLPLQFSGAGTVRPIRLSEAERIELSIGPGIPPASLKRSYSVDVECIWLKKRTTSTGSD